MSLDVTILSLYDEEVARHTTGVKVAAARDAIRPEVRKLVAKGKRDLDLETDMLLDTVLRSARSDRSRSLKRDLEFLLDAFSEDEHYADPMLQQAYRLGDQAGIDKVLRHWTAEDFANLVVTRYRVAAESTAAAVALDKTTQRVLERMRVAGVAHVGDVDWSSMSLPVFEPDSAA